MIKKVLCVILVLTLVLGTCTTAFAADAPYANGKVRLREFDRILDVTTNYDSSTASYKVTYNGAVYTFKKSNYSTDSNGMILITPTSYFDKLGISYSVASNTKMTVSAGTAKFVNGITGGTATIFVGAATSGLAPWGRALLTYLGAIAGVNWTSGLESGTYSYTVYSLKISGYTVGVVGTKTPSTMFVSGIQ